MFNLFFVLFSLVTVWQQIDGQEVETGPTFWPTKSPRANPSPSPTKAPRSNPTQQPTKDPSYKFTNAPNTSPGKP